MMSRATRRRFTQRLVLWLAGMHASGANAVAPGLQSADGRWRLDVQGEGVVVRAVDGSLQRAHAAVSLDGREHGRPAGLLALAARRSFVVAFAQLPELWEISLDPAAEPIFDGYVHDYRMGEAIATPGFLGVRRTRLDEPLPGPALAAGGAYVLGRAADRVTAQGPRVVLVLVQLDIRRPIARFEVDADPDLALARPLGPTAGPLASGAPEAIVVPDRRGAAPLVIDLRAARLRPR